MSRNCPQCGRNLSKADVYFCSSCGAVVGNSAEVLNKRYYQVSGAVLSAKNITAPGFSFWGLLAGVGVFLLLAASVILSSYLMNNAVSNGKTMLETAFPNAVVQSEELQVSVEATVPTLAEKGTEVESFLPFDTDFAVAFYSPSDFTDVLDFLGVENSFDLDFLKNSNRSPFVVVVDPAAGDVEEEDGIGILFFPRNPVPEGLYKKYISGEFSEIDLDELVIVTNRSEMGNEITKISKGLKKGLNLNSSYVNIKNKIPETVRSKIFVFTDTGVGYVNKFDVDSMPETLKTLVLSYMRSGSYYGFLKYE